MMLPLFRRFFSDSESGDRHGGHTVISAMKAESIGAELAILLNTRAAFTEQICRSFDRRTVLDYGLPDFLHYSPVSKADSREIARMIADVVRAHEPRLCHIRVDVTTPRLAKDVINAVIHADIVSDSSRRESLRIPMMIGRSRDPRSSDAVGKIEDTALGS